jgi:hypothetical protein
MVLTLLEQNDRIEPGSHRVSGGIPATVRRPGDVRHDPDSSRSRAEPESVTTEISHGLLDICTAQVSAPAQNPARPVPICRADAALLASAREEDQIAIWIAHDECPGTPRLRLESLMEFDPRSLKLKKKWLRIIEGDGSGE